MKTVVRYCPQTGIARKLAVGVFGVQAEDVSRKLDENVDGLFICDSVYWDGVDTKVRLFLQEPGHRIGSLVDLSTAAFSESSYKQVKVIAEQAGIPAISREFHCKGSFMDLHKGRPDAEDVAAARKFARQVAGTAA